MPTAPHIAPLAFRRTFRVSPGRDQLLRSIESLLDPLALVLSLWAIALFFQSHIAPQKILLAVILFSVTFPGTARLAMPPWRAITHILAGWLALFGLLFVFGYASGYIGYFDDNVVWTWLWAAPACQVAGHFLLRLGAPAFRQLQGQSKRAVVAGMNQQGVDLARKLAGDVYANIRVAGFFDDRARSRLTHDNWALLGSIKDLPAFAKEHHIDLIYLSLPMASQPRIHALLDGLRDTTASIYFVPDTFVTDLIQGRMDAVGGVPVVAVCDTPFTGVNAVIKRLSDIVQSPLIVALASPLFVGIALLVKLSSPGPVIFTQRRYGLDGREITVYKFRTMTVMEDEGIIRQAQRNDPRVTRFGAVLRKTSLDELPQFFNVLQGRMSIVGPRPHAVAHNEMYRHLIKGYMIRHKVKPGITGWAQVNGCRGETETLEKMSARIDYDLDYLRNWSLRLDLYIIAKTAWVLVKGRNAW